MSTTAVPLRPVNKGGLALLWIGLGLLVAAAAVWALFLSNAPQIKLETVRAGTGATPTDTDVAIIKYEGKLADGTVFDSGDQVPLPVGRMIPGFSQGLKRMHVGGKYRLFIPAELAYGNTAQGPIPANSDLSFDVELLDVKSEAEMQQMMMMQQMMQQQMQQQMQGEAGGSPQP
ncbi:peptidylprolyl isomerase [Sphingomonas lacunae]|uniref:Peptidyl-prolyl cis-trans isomerase n=1 Tax=Sphingomonas lacunae TaxID=2698828 RepID=A0A6M4AT23_9SPHN|nr:FKBP-type peptidyl-prolyl cis-trans isomerase [Sphingomonas lacunae]QJQ31570.1 peptidylprolyl isomerase [Sphingomonas lacunae]